MHTPEAVSGIPHLQPLQQQAHQLLLLLLLLAASAARGARPRVPLVPLGLQQQQGAVLLHGQHAQRRLGGSAGLLQVGEGLGEQGAA